MARSREKRINEEIKKIVSGMIMNGLKDPRVSRLASITEVETTRDLRYTTIYVSVYGKDDSLEETLEGLNSAKGYIRKKIGDELKMHHTPEPIFKADNAIKHGMHINEVINKLHEEEGDGESHDTDEDDEI